MQRSIACLVACGGVATAPQDAAIDTGIPDSATIQDAARHSCKEDVSVTPAASFTRLFLESAGYSIAFDRCGNAYVTGSLAGSTDFGDAVRKSAGKDDAFLLKLDPQGHTVWSRSFGTSDDDTGF